MEDRGEWDEGGGWDGGGGLTVRQGRGVVGRSGWRGASAGQDGGGVARRLGDVRRLEADEEA